MPHAEENMSTPITNGETPSSQFISHLTSYPVVSDSISTFKSNPYGARTLNFADKGYSSFIAPVIPYAARPYSYVEPYVSPYVSRADVLASNGLDKVDSQFPIVKSTPQELKDTTFSIVGLPGRKANEAKDYVLGTWSNEYKKCGGEGVVAGGKAMVTTSLVVTSDVLGYISAVFNQKKAEAEKTIKEKTNN